MISRLGVVCQVAAGLAIAMVVVALVLIAPARVDASDGEDGTCEAGMNMQGGWCVPDGTVVEVGEVEARVEIPPGVAVEVRRGTVAGIVLASLALPVLVVGIAGSVFTMGDTSARAPSAIVLGGAFLLQAVGVPLMLAMNMRARKAAGLKPLGGLGLAGWVVYAASFASVPLLVISGLRGHWPFTIISASVCTWFTEASAVIGFFASKYTLRMVREMEEGTSIRPFIAPLRGGVMAGLGGAF